MSDEPFARHERPSDEQCGRERSRPASTPISTGRNDERERVDQPREERDGRDQEDRHLGAGRESDLRRELDLAAARDDHRAAVLGGVADDRDDDRGDEEVAEGPTCSAKTSSEPTSTSATSAVTTVAAPRTASARRNDQRRRGLVVGHVQRRWCRLSERHVAIDVDDEQDDRDDGIEVTCERVPVAVARPAGTAG